MKLLSLFLGIVISLSPTYAAAQLPVVPGAPLTYGMSTRAAYGCGTAPVILHVTSLSDSGGGSLRSALTDTRPRVIVFDVSGYITWNSVVTISSPCFTVAGQTAPTGGITIRGAGGSSEVALYVGTRDGLVQHIRIRPGNKGCNSAVQFYGGNQQNLVFDHTSISWGQDDNFAFNWTNGQPTNATVYRSISSEGIFSADGSEACTGGGRANGHGMLMGSMSGPIAVVQSLFSTNFERNPYMQGGTRAVILNNIIYQWHGPWGIFLNNGSPDGSANGSVWFASVVGNRFIAGPNTCCTGGGDDNEAYQFVYSTNNPVGNMAGNAIYRSDNTLAPVPPGIKVTEQLNQYNYDPNVSSPPSQAPMPSGYTPLQSATLESFLLPIVGARPKDRDGVDNRVIDNVGKRAGKYVHDVAEVGGYPTIPNNQSTFKEVSNPHGISASGYTNLEVQLQQLAASLEGGAIPPTPTPGPDDVTPASGTIFVSDTFTGVAGIPLTQHDGEVGATWTKQAASIDGLKISGVNTLINSGVGDGTLTLASGMPLSNEYDIHWMLGFKTVVAGHQYGIWARAQQSNPLTAIAFIYDAASGVWTLNQFASTGSTVLGTCTRAVTGNVEVILRVRAASVHGVVGGTQCTSSANAVASSSGQIGVSTYFTSVADTDTTGIHFDSIEAIDVITGGGSGPTVFQILALIGLFTVIIVVLVAYLLLRREPDSQ